MASIWCGKREDLGFMFSKAFVKEVVSFLKTTRAACNLWFADNANVG